MKRTLGMAFAGVGALFLVMTACLLVLDARFVARAARTSGEVVALRFNGKGSAAPDIAFTTGEGAPRRFASSSHSSPGYAVGDRVEIIYDPADPEIVLIDSWAGRWVLPTIFGGIGGLGWQLGTLLLLLHRRRRRVVARLLGRGERIDAPVVAVELDRRVRVDHKHPWVIRCRGLLPGETRPRSFVSRRLWVKTQPQVGPTMPVYFDRRWPRGIVVDTRAIEGDLGGAGALTKRGR